MHLGSRSEPQVAGMKHPKGGLEEYIVGYLCASELHTKLDIIKKLHVGKAGSEITLLAIRYDLPLPYYCRGTKITAVSTGEKLRQGQQLPPPTPLS